MARSDSTKDKAIYLHVANSRTNFSPYMDTCASLEKIPELRARNKH